MTISVIELFTLDTKFSKSEKCILGIVGIYRINLHERIFIILSFENLDPPEFG